MRFYLAPLEGITTYVYRRALNRFFGPMDKYFIPFIVPHVKRSFNAREKNDLSPEHNEGMYAVPQILTCSGEDFVRTADAMAQMGYREINLNLGCPSKTVTSKGRGAGFLARPDELDQFLEYIFRHTDASVRISVKTRTGTVSHEEFPRLLEIYNRYPIEELIVHPRVLQAFYKGSPDWDVFETAMEDSRNPVCYNGDIRTAGDFSRLTARFPEVNRVMMGRGVIADPFLTERLSGRLPGWSEEAGGAERSVLGQEELDRLRAFHRQLVDDYSREMQEDNNVLFKMKEIWSYMAALFPGGEKWMKKLRKCKRLSEYKICVEQLWEGAGRG